MKIIKGLVVLLLVAAVIAVVAMHEDRNVSRSGRSAVQR